MFVLKNSWVGFAAYKTARQGRTFTNFVTNVCFEKQLGWLLQSFCKQLG
jgi:hypothetical protein